MQQNKKCRCSYKWNFIDYSGSGSVFRVPHGGAGQKFPTFAVVSIKSSAEIDDDYGNSVRLVLPYRMSGERLHTVLSEVREKHPDAPIALVVETIDKFEEPLKRLVGMRIIDGVLPLNLRLDVFMAAVDLLMKGRAFSRSSSRQTHALFAVRQRQKRSKQRRDRQPCRCPCCKQERGGGADDTRSADPRPFVQGHAEQDHR